MAFGQLLGAAISSPRMQQVVAARASGGGKKGGVGKTSKAPMRTAGVPITGVAGPTGFTFGGGAKKAAARADRSVMGGIFRRAPRSKRLTGMPQRQGLSVGRTLGAGMFSSPVVSAMSEPFGRSLVRGHHSRSPKRSAPSRGR